MDFDIKRTVGKLLLGMGALGIVLTLPAVGFSAEIQPLDQLDQLGIKTPFRNGALHTKQELSETSALDRYDTAQFSVDYPKGWQVNPQGEDGVAIVSIADGVTMPIRTDIVILREDPQVAVPQRLDQIAAAGLSVQRYSLVTVDGQSGLRIWYEPEVGQQALVTFVGYGNQQTVVMTSYHAQDPVAEPLVTQIHGSFVNHSVAQADISE
ncbi:hypothetical protein [Leptothoe sp. PORK10 BA2]|jgi:hypothetical protein|uniref:hypothetical protein n=1 Tax=Leptothoe sp. PORK10 BA2 TaxID=3110254 RepID=UPI002B214BC8|nr:hypothetical protein [Leptothoe sp. PORK10 BA2]MEA5465021.1 hypothetical protein [Leptothoe sp. PORK10 BA2]